MADYGNIGKASKLPSIFNGSREIIDLRGLPGVNNIAGHVPLYLPRSAGNLFTWENPTSSASAVISGAVPNVPIVLIKEGTFAGYYPVNSAGDCYLYRLDYADYIAFQYGSSVKEWDVVSTAGGITVTARTAGGYPTVPIGSRILTLQAGKFVAVTPE